MDMSLVVVHHAEEKISFAGANNPLIYISENEMKLLKGDKMPIGSHYKKGHEPFTRHEFDYKKGDCIYLMSDGYADQFGGLRDKKFSMKRFQNLLLQIQNQNMTSQKNTLARTFKDWKGAQSQIDDVLVMGVRL
jgi:serine phosphatase RsbU (regulator of sigma subunit)